MSKHSAVGHPLRLIVCGALGRMGSQTAKLALEDDRFSLVAGVEHRTETIPPALFPIISEMELPKHIERADILVDFSVPAASVRYAHVASRRRKPIVIGTTGFQSAQISKLRALAKKTPIMLSPNFSLGMNVLMLLGERAGALLPDYDSGISEIHHTKKKDTPSGSALRLAECVRAARPNPQPVTIVSQRLGTVIGEHTLTLAGPFERIELTHRAESRDAFAQGALAAARWLFGRRPGFYDMRDMLKLR